jgi:hypothetical protein
MKKSSESPVLENFLGVCLYYPRFTPTLLAAPMLMGATVVEANPAATGGALHIFSCACPSIMVHSILSIDQNRGAAFLTSTPSSPAIPAAKNAILKRTIST